jgi:hypothetical protein
MAWTTPRTWLTGETCTASQFNTHIRDNENFLRAHHGCLVYKSAVQTVAAGNTDVLTWNTETYDTDVIHDTVTNNSRLIVPTGFDGYWEFECGVRMDADAAIDRTTVVRLRQNAAGSDASGTLLRHFSWGGHTVPNSGIARTRVNLVAGDYVEAFFNAVTEARDIQAGAEMSYFMAVYLGN